MVKPVRIGKSQERNLAAKNAIREVQAHQAAAQAFIAKYGGSAEARRKMAADPTILGKFAKSRGGNA